MTDEDQSPLTARLLDEDHISTTEAGDEPSHPSNKNETIVEADLVESQERESEFISTTAEQSFERGEKQPPAFRDWQYGVVFLVQFITVITLGIIYGKNEFFPAQSSSNGGDSENDQILKKINLQIAISVGTTVLLVLVAFVVMTKLGKSFITCSVWTSAILSFMTGVTALSVGQVGFGLFSLFCALIGCCYAVRVRNRIPFAAANLSAAMSSIKANGGVVLTVMVFGALMFGWMNLWIISLIGVMDVQVVCDEYYDQCTQTQKGWMILPWVFFLFWTQQVFKNLIHTTIAGLVGSWYFSAVEARSFCSKALTSSIFRSLTYSFGSICFGSLLVAILQTLDFIVVSLRNERDRNNGNIGVSILLCCLDCILSLLQGIMEYFNKWAFVYVGVYGYSFMTAGKKVMNLFEERGWTVIINDHLISRALGLMCLIISLISGIVPLAFFGRENQSNPEVFFIGSFISLLLALTIMSTIDSAVSTIIVCFAEAPEELERNHSTHSRDMKEAWNKVYQIRF